MSSSFINYFEALSEDQKIELLAFPAVVFSTIGNVDGNWDNKENAAYLGHIVLDHRIDSDYQRMRLLYDPPEGVSRLLPYLKSFSQGDFYQLLGEAAARVVLLVQAMPDNGLKTNYLCYTLEGMLKVATSSGGCLLGRGEKMDENEFETIEAICEVLGITAIHFLRLLQRRNFTF
jgi:hypothetical protein